jgi:hypothetical protein
LTIQLPPWLGVVVSIVVCGGALWKGGREERLIGAVLLLNFAISIFLRDISWPRVQLAGFIADLATLALMFAVALWSKKFWPMFAAAFQLLSVMTHVGKMLDPLMHQLAYLTAIIIWTYLILISLGVGTWNHWRARRQAASVGAVSR